MKRISTSCLLAAALLFSASNAPNAQAARSATSVPHQRIYVLRGFINIFSPGMDKLGYELSKKGADVEIANHLRSSSLGAEAIRDCQSGKINSIVIVGHSLGAGAAAAMAEQLRQAGVRVALLVTVDPVSSPVIPGNVREARNYYLSNGIGKAVQPDAKSRGSVKNIDMKDGNVDHVSITTATVVQDQVMREIKAAAGGRCR